jgi:4-amino-4-deoxychorismate lyase
MFLINGELNETLSAQDRGLHYGDGVFETIAVNKGNLLCWDKHYERLQLGCQILDFACPAKELLQNEAQQVISDAKEVLKIILTRGAGGRGYNPPKQITPTRIVANYPWPDYSDKQVKEGVKVRICDFRLGFNPKLAGIKHLNRLEQVLARNEWTDMGIAEGLMLDQNDNIIEGTMSNIFMVQGNKLITPDLSQCGIDGIIRQYIIELAPELDMHIEIRTVKQDELFSAEELFLCNSTFGLWPVRELEGKQINQGPYATKIRKALIKNETICA